MIEYFSTNDPPKNLKLNISSKIINSKIITSNYINYMVSDNNLTSFVVNEGIV